MFAFKPKVLNHQKPKMILEKNEAIITIKMIKKARNSEREKERACS